MPHACRSSVLLVWLSQSRLSGADGAHWQSACATHAQHCTVSITLLTLAVNNCCCRFASWFQHPDLSCFVLPWLLAAMALSAQCTLPVLQHASSVQPCCMSQLSSPCCCSRLLTYSSLSLCGVLVCNYIWSGCCQCEAWQMRHAIIVLCRPCVARSLMHTRSTLLSQKWLDRLMESQVVVVVLSTVTAGQAGHGISQSLAVKDCEALNRFVGHKGRPVCQPCRCRQHHRGPAAFGCCCFLIPV